jgi:hypothetical protein
VAIVAIFWAAQRKQIAERAVRALVDSEETLLAVRALVDSEETILELTPKLDQLAQSIRNLDFPNGRSHGLFAAEVEVVDLDFAKPRLTFSKQSVGVKTYTWPISRNPRKLIKDGAKDDGMWRPLIEEVDHFSEAKFYFVSGQFTDDRLGEFRSKISFHGRALTVRKTWVSVSATQDVVWRKSAADPPPAASAWQIVDWALTKLQTTESDELLFTEVLSDALPEKAVFSKAHKSIHEQYITQLLSEGSISLPYEIEPEYFERISTGQHPGISVVDLDADGLDDLYVTMRWGKNLFLHNLGDGTFEETAESLGLAIDGQTTSAVFADFDNDGDKDVVLGGYLRRTLYLINEDGHFVNRSDHMVSVPLPYLVTSVSAVDYNNDGLLDVYLSTYGFPGGQPLAKVWAGKFLPPKDAEEVKRRLYGADRNEYYQRYLSAVGPPNLLLVNRGGGRFDVAPENDQLAVWLNTFQSTWSDYDGDGDCDVYISSDFGPDYLFRNDGSGGFVDVTAKQGGDAMMGFGMGASWGDYDNDGHTDLYISNMYSKAGMRITDQLAGLNPGFQRSADGNRLFRNRGDAFQLVSGSEPPALQVTKAGWSWGGQFADFDNDGYLDIYVASGYFTAPKKVACDVDL